MFSRRQMLLAAGAVSAAPALAQAAGTESAKLTALFDQFFQSLLRRNPESATNLGLDTGANADLRAKLHDDSPAAIAADRLAARGISAEVIDPRTLVPLDVDAIVASVQKTGRLLVVDEDYLNFGMTGEISALIAERLDEIKLRAPIRRLGVAGVSIPYSPALEKVVIPQVEHVIEAAERLLTSRVL